MEQQQQQHYSNSFILFRIGMNAILIEWIPIYYVWYIYFFYQCKFVAAINLL